MVYLPELPWPAEVFLWCGFICEHQCGLIRVEMLDSNWCVLCQVWWLILHVSTSLAMGCPDIWLKIILVCLWRCFWMGLAFELVDWVNRWPFQYGGLILHWRLNRTQRSRGRGMERTFSLFGCLWVGTLVFCLWTWTQSETIPWSLLVVQLTELHTFKHLNLYNCVSQLVTINLPPLFLYLSLDKYSKWDVK